MNITNIKNDLNLFKDETLKALRDIEKQLLEKIKIKMIETEIKIADFDNKLTKFQEINKRMYDSVFEQQIYLEKINHLTEFKSRTETRLISFDVKLSNYLSDLINIKNRYDKIFLEQLTVPGIIGPSCKFKSISDYLNDTINNADQLKMEKDLMKKQINELKIKNELFEKNLVLSADNAISTSKLYTDTKVNEIKNLIVKKFEDFDDILVNTKSKIEENVLKNEQISTAIKNEIKLTKDEIINLVEEKNKENEKIKNEIKKNQNSEMKKELNEIKKNFTELKKNMEKQIVNAYKLGKNKNMMNSYNSNNNIFLKTNSNMITSETKIKNNFGETEIIKVTSQNTDKPNFSSNKLFTKKNSNNNININKSINTISNILKSQNDLNKYTNNINKDNKENDNQLNMQEKYHMNIGGKNIQIKNSERSSSNIYNNLKEKKNENKTEYFTIKNPINTINNHQENKIIIPQKLSDKIISSNEKNLLHIKKRKSRNKSFSKIENNIVLIEDKNLSNEVDLNNINNNNNNNNLDEQKIKKLNSENKNKKKKKYVIHSIDGENTLKKLNRKISEYNFLKKNKEKKNIPIKLMKNKIQSINDNNNAYLQQQSPTLGLYKEYFNRKLKEKKERQKLNEIINIPTKVSPVFGRTAYTEFIKANNDIDLKNYNGNMNIIINDNIDENIDKFQYFNTINGESSPKLYSKNDKDKKVEKIEDDSANLSV